jgi:hypothetical protein
MKTFEEALTAVCKSDGKRESLERQERAQGEFMQDVFGSEILQGLADEFARTICKMNEGEDGEAEIDDEALAQIFLNGVNLGLNIGIQMERTEVEKPTLWRRVRAMLAK